MDRVVCTVLKTGQVRPVCEECSTCITARHCNMKRHGKVTYGKLCTGCLHFKNHGKRHPFHKHQKYSRPWVEFKKSSCESCKFVPEHSCQLDVDHIDGDKKNNSRENLQTLCANCHRLKTYQKKEWRKISKRKVANGGW